MFDSTKPLTHLSTSPPKERKKKKKPMKTIRFDVPLVATDENSYPCFNYRQMVREICPESAEDLDDDSLDDKNDFYRYEYEEDSYVDNSEAFPDSYPPNMEPAIKGFFLNSGKLKLKEISPKPAQRKKKSRTVDDVLKQKRKELKKLKKLAAGLKKPKLHSGINKFGEKAVKLSKKKSLFGTSSKEKKRKHFAESQTSLESAKDVESVFKNSCKFKNTQDFPQVTSTVEYRKKSLLDKSPGSRKVASSIHRPPLVDNKQNPNLVLASPKVQTNRIEVPYDPLKIKMASVDIKQKNSTDSSAPVSFLSVNAGNFSVKNLLSSSVPNNTIAKTSSVLPPKSSSIFFDRPSSSDRSHIYNLVHPNMLKEHLSKHKVHSYKHKEHSNKHKEQSKKHKEHSKKLIIKPLKIPKGIELIDLTQSPGVLSQVKKHGSEEVGSSRVPYLSEKMQGRLTNLMNSGTSLLPVKETSKQQSRSPPNVIHIERITSMPSSKLSLGKRKRETLPVVFSGAAMNDLNKRVNLSSATNDTANYARLKSMPAGIQITNASDELIVAASSEIRLPKV